MLTPDPPPSPFPTLQEVYAQAGLIELEMPDDLRYRLRGYLHNMHKSGVLRNLVRGPVL